MGDSFNLLMVLVTFMFIAGLIAQAVTGNELRCHAPQTLLVETTDNAKIARCVDVRGEVVK